MQVGALGLTIETPFVIPDLGGVSTGNSTTFYDAPGDRVRPVGVGGRRIRVIHGYRSRNQHLLAVAGAWPVPNLDLQSDPDNGGVLLLGGTINSAVITGILNSPAGSLVSADVTIASGAILNTAEGLPLNGTASSIPGNLSWSFLDASPQFPFTALAPPLLPSRQMQRPVQRSGAGAYGHHHPTERRSGRIFRATLAPNTLLTTARRSRCGCRCGRLDRSSLTVLACWFVVVRRWDRAATVFRLVGGQGSMAL